MTTLLPSSRAIFRRPTLDDLELIYRRRELARLRASLAAREAHLADLRNQLNAFEGRYIRQVGVLYIQLDEWHDRLAELKDTSRPPPPTDEASSQQERGEAEETALRPGTDLDLKALYREVAKRIHPDHARDALDEQHRTQLMAQANAALLREDAPLLHRMLHSHDLPVQAVDPRSELIQTRALIQHLRQDLLTLDSEMQDLAQSDMADLFRRTSAAAAEGKDILAELAARVKGQIGIAMSRYERELHRIQHPLKVPRTGDRLKAAASTRSRRSSQP